MTSNTVKFIYKNKIFEIKKPDSNEPDYELASMVCEKSMQKGLLLVHTGRESIKIGPPLTIPDDALEEGIDVLEESITNIVTNLNSARNEFTNLIDILNRNAGTKIAAGAKDLQKIMKDRIEGWLGGTYRIFQKPRGLFKLFQKFKPTDEAYANAINLFRRYLAKTDKTITKSP